MLGAIAGDIIGSVFEFCPTKREDFPLFHVMSKFTDDTVLTVAVADAILNAADYGETIHRYARSFPGRGYGGNFSGWIESDDPQPYKSFGNGSAMRVSPVGWLFETEEEVLAEARKSAECTHNHPEGIKGAQAVALGIWLARHCRASGDENKAAIREEISTRFGYDLDRSLEMIRPTYRFDVTCQGSVPEAIIAFLESESFEDAVRKAISLGGDADTQAAIAGSIAEAFYGGVPSHITDPVRARLPNRFLAVLAAFSKTHRTPNPQT